MKVRMATVSVGGGGVIMPGKTAPGVAGEALAAPPGVQVAGTKEAGAWPALSPEQFGIVVQKPAPQPAQQPNLPPRTGRDGGLAVPEA